MHNSSDAPPDRPRHSLNLGGLRLDTRAAVIVISSTLLLMLDHYHSLLPAATFAEGLRAKAIERAVLYLAVPLAVILLGFRDRPADYGLTWGDWRQGLKWTGVCVLIAAPVLILAARTPGMAAYYARFPDRPLELVLTAGLDLVGWEFLFRGFLLFGLLRVVGPLAVLLQAVPFALAHLGKPELETLSTIFGGTLFGWVAWRSRSFVYPFLIHWFVYTVTVLAAQAAAR